MQHTRRDILRGSLAVAGLGVLGFPEWALPVLAQGETLVPFTDLPPTFNPTPTAITRLVDIRTIDGPFTPKDQFFTTQHYGHPVVDPASFKLKVTGLVNTPLSLSLDDLKAMKPRSSWPASSARATGVRFQGLASNGKWTGIPLKAVLDQVGVKAEAREFVFFGADKGERRSGVPHREVHRRPAVRPEPDSRAGAVAGPLPGLGAQRRAADPAPGLAAAAARPGLVRRRQRQVARADSPAGRAVPGQVPGALVPDAEGRDDRRRDQVEGNRRHAHAAEVVHRAGHAAMAATRCWSSC